MKLDKRFFLTALLSVGLSFGLAACSSDSNDETKPDDNNEVKELCGNGVIDAEEVCDIGVDKIQHNGDDVMPNNATCEMYGEASSSDKGKTWVSGAPACAKDCKGFAKGTCVSQDTQEQKESEGVNGILKCGSDLAVSDNGATAQVTYEMGSTTADSGVKAAIVCSAPTAKIDAAIQSVQYVDAAEGSAQLSFDVSGLSAGDYVCYVVVKAADKGAVVCPLENGTPAKASGDISALAGSTKDYKVEAAEGVVATWNNFNITDMKELITTDGIVSQAGSDTAATLKFVVVTGSLKDDYVVKNGRNAANDDNTALQLGTNGGSSKNGFAQTKTITADANSHLLISSANMAGKTIKIVAKTGTYGGKYSVVAGETEIIQEFASESFDSATGTIPAETTTLYLYPWFESCSESSCGNLTIDSIVIE